MTPNEACDIIKWGLLDERLVATHLNDLISTDLVKLFLDAIILLEEKSDIRRGL